MTSQKQYFIETFGCQMNDRDSEIMGQLLRDSSYGVASEIENADLIIVNTCSVREKAEQKAYSLLGRLKHLKKNNPSLVIAVTGCVAQADGDKLFKRIPHADIVVGPQQIYDLPILVEDCLRRIKPQVATKLSSSFSIPPFLPDIDTGSTIKRFVTIMQGCNNFCAYCVVPFTRGREISRSSEDILSEVKHLANSGIKEITLLGQNVNSYGPPSFPDLLREVATVQGVERIRFTTSHPKDLSEDLMRCFSEIDKLCPHFHLPVQSGSDGVLSRMNRKYTSEDYLNKVQLLRSNCPEIALTTDIIVGFPGESDDDFEATMRLVEEVRYHSAFSFKYSDRPHARSVDFPDKVEEQVKSERLARLQKKQNEISLERNQEYAGKILNVMVEGQAKSETQWSGRAPTNHIVNFTGGKNLQAGDTVSVEISEGCLNSLRGTIVLD